MAERRPIRASDIQEPDRILSNLLKDYVDGVLSDYNFLFRASVIQIDTVGSAFSGPGTSNPEDPPNPKNSIRARIMTNARDKDTVLDDLPVFWPLFPHDTMPLKESEHVYVIFEDSNDKSHGLWVARIPEPATFDKPNLTPGANKYLEDPANDFSDIGVEQAVQDTDEPPETVAPSDEFTVEEVPKFVHRVGDRVIEGSNNTLVVLGRDRPSDAASGEVDFAGTVDIVAGRANPDNMDFGADKARVYVSSKTDADGNLELQVGPPGGVAASIIVSSEQIRIVAKDRGVGTPGIKIVVQGGDVHLEGSQILLGLNAAQKAVLGDKLVAELGKLIDALAAPPLAALGSVPLPPHPSFVAKINLIKATLATNILSTKNKVE